MQTRKRPSKEDHQCNAYTCSNGKHLQNNSISLSLSLSLSLSHTHTHNLVQQQKLINQLHNSAKAKRCREKSSWFKGHTRRKRAAIRLHRKERDRQEKASLRKNTERQWPSKKAETKTSAIGCQWREREKPWEQKRAIFSHSTWWSGPYWYRGRPATSKWSLGLVDKNACQNNY